MGLINILNYLAIDASTEACSVALALGDKIFSRYDLCPQSHSLMLLPMVDEVLKEAGVELSQLDGLIYGRGPGSFTGVRIGIGVAQGLAFSAELPVVGVSTLQAMAQKAYRLQKKEKVISAIDARMSEVYTAHFILDSDKIMQVVGEEAVLPPADASELYKCSNDSDAKAYVVGTGWDAYAETLVVDRENTDSPKILFPDAIDMLTIGIKEFSLNGGLPAEQAQPVYVRDTVSWKKLPGR